MNRIKTIALFVCALIAVHAAAQQHPNVEKGFKADHAYETSDLDAVNLFNANLNVTVPIGGSYPVSQSLSYGFMLSYSGNNWEYRQKEDIDIPTNMSPPNPIVTLGTIRWAVPYPKLNAGMGWLFTLGRLIPSHPESPTSDRLAYQGPDGSEHELFPTLHEGSGATVDPNVFYTRGSDYIRATKLVNGWVLEFPDGTRREFGTDGRLTKIRDRFDKQVTITYYATASAATSAGVPAPDSTACGSTYLAWKIADPHRTHYAYFRPGIPSTGNAEMNPAFEERVCEVNLAAFNGNRAYYRFAYSERAISRQKVSSPEANDTFWRPSPAITVPLLTNIQLPSGSSYDMTYDIGMYKPTGGTAVGVNSDQTTTPNEFSDLVLQNNPGSYSGHLTALRLPTKGRYEWSYQKYLLPPKYGQVSDPMEPNEVLVPSIVAAVYQKKKFVSDADPAVWTYTQTLVPESPWGNTTSITTVDAPDGTSTKNYFSVFWQEGMARIYDYGAPFTKAPVANNPYNGMYLASRMSVPGGERRTYVTYEQDPIANVWDSMEANRRLKARLTVFEDGSETKEEYSDFDGLGHYRTTTITGAGGVNRVITRNYYPPAGDAWLTEMYDSSEVTDLAANGSVVSRSRTEVCFDADTGRLTRTRALRNATVSANDLLTVYKDEDLGGQNVDGNVSQEEYYGGDANPLSGAVVSNTCGTIGGIHRYRLLHTYASGTRRTTQYDGAFNFKTLDLTIDASTGLPSQSRDVAGVGTALQYDTMGRLISLAPTSSSERRVMTTYTYSEATSSVGPSVTVQNTCPSSAPECDGSKLPEARYYYDFFGRLVQQRSSMGAAGTSAWSVTTFTYDKTGRRKASSVPFGATSGNRADVTAPGVITWNYDLLGRTTKITQPDASEVNFTYASPTVSARTTKVQTSAGPTDVTTEERSDALGRLVEVTEDATGSPLHTFYSYDAGDRLIRVTDGSPAVQQRVFEYDGAGLLKREDHPEADETNYQYDARGHVTSKRTGASLSGSTLLFQYDGAERLLNVQHDPDGSALTYGASMLKEFTYGNSVGSAKLGRLSTAKRYNYASDLGGTGIATVTETFSYDSSGRLSSKDTLVSVPGLTNTTFTDAYEYDALGALDSVTYPNCSACNASARTVENFYEHGYLRSVGNYATGITHHPNGMWAQFSRPKADPTDLPIVESQTLAAHQMPRPETRSISNQCGEIPITGPTVSQSGGYADVSVTAPSGSTFQWYEGSQPISGATSATLHVAVTQTTSYWVRVSKNDCTADSAPAVVTFNSCPTPTISAPSSVNMRMAATASVPQSGTYSWSIVNGQIQGATNAQQVSFLPGCSGNVTLNVTVTPSCGGPAVPLSVVIPITVPAISLQATPATIAQGGSSTLTVGVNLSGTWTITWAAPLSTTQVTGSANVTVSPQTTTTYEVVQVNGCAMSPWASKTVTVTPPAPVATTATRSGAAVLVAWSIPSGAVIDSYRVERCATACASGGAWSLAGTTAALSFTDVTVAANAAYAYRVVSVAGGTYSSSASPPDFASTWAFTDDPLAVLGTQRVSHITELRSAVNALRSVAGLTAYSFTDTVVAGSMPKALYLNELLAAVNPARNAFGRANVAFTAPAPAAGGMPLAAHVNELRGGVQ